MREDRIVAELGIRRLHALCTDAVWRKDAAMFAGCFAEDGEWKIAGLLFRGREAIAQGLSQLVAANERVLMQFGSPILEVAGDDASGRTYAIEHVKRNDGAGFSTIGIYYERFVRQGDEWRFRWRHFDFCYFGKPDLSDPLFAFQDYGPPPMLPAADRGTAGLQAGGG